MALSLVVGPAHAGKVALLLERYVAALERDPWLVVPNRLDVDRVERDLIRRRPALLAGTIGTFDDLFRAIADDAREGPAIASDTQRGLAIRRAVAARELEDLRSSASTPGFADTLLQTIGEIESALVDPRGLEGELPQLVDAYRDELARLGLRDRDGVRREAVERLRGDLGAWGGSPVFAYGFEDLTGAEWALLEALAARTEVTVSIPYEPARAAFAALSRTVEDLAGLAGSAIRELPRSALPTTPPALAHLERELFSDEPAPGPSLDGAIRFLEGAGTRGTAELLASEVAALLRGGTAPERVAVVCESVDRWRAPLEGGVRAARDSAGGRACPPPRRDAARTGVARDSPLRVARGQSRRPLRVPPLAVLGAGASIGRLRRGPPARPGCHGPGAGRRGDREAPRRAGAGARRPEGKRRSSRCHADPDRADDPERVGPRIASDDQRRPDRRACVPSSRAHARRARRARVRGSRRYDRRRARRARADQDCS